MKTKNILFALALSATLFAGSHASSVAQTTAATTKDTPVPAFKVHQIKPLLFRLTYNNPKSGRLFIKIMDSNRHVIFAENSTSGAPSARFFDLSPVLDGTYTFEVVDGKDKFSESLDILTETKRLVNAKD